MLNYYEQKTLLSQKKIKGYVYVWPGCGYLLQKVGINENKISIEELAFICIKSGKGLFINENDLTEEEIKEHDESDIYYYCNMSFCGLDNGYLLIENMQVDKNIELYS